MVSAGAVRVPTGAALVVGVLAFAVTLLLSAVLTPISSADITISQPGEGAGQTLDPRGLAVDFETGRLYVADKGNRRIDVFDSAGNFEMAWGWGVADGSFEAQTCGPAATPPTAICLRGLAGGGAGQFTDLYDIAVDNDPASSSHHDIYVVDANGTTQGGLRPSNTRIQKFDPEGNFLLTFGGGVVTGGAEGTGDLSVGSKTVSNVKTTKKAFEVSQTISGAGIPPQTMIVALGNKTITLSNAAEASGSGVALSVAGGAGNVPMNEVQSVGGGGNKIFTGPAPDGISATTGATAEGVLHPESTTITEVSNISGAILPGERIFCCGDGGGLQVGTAITAYDPGAGTITLSQPTASKVAAGKVEFTIFLPDNPSAALMQSALEALPNLDPGEVAVSGPTGGRFAVEFKGPRYGDTNLAALGGAGNKSLIQNGGAGAEICTAAIAESCTGGVEGTGHGQFAQAVQLAIGPGGTVYVADSILFEEDGMGGLFENRLQKFEPTGEFVEELPLPESEEVLLGLAADPLSGDFYVATSEQTMRRYDASGGLLNAFPRSTNALATDPAGQLFSVEGEDSISGNTYWTIAQRDASGNTLRRFAYGDVSVDTRAVAPFHSASGEVYSTVGDTVRHLSFPPPGPILVPAPCLAKPVGNSKATLNAEINPEGKPTTFHYEYVDQHSFETEGGFASPKTKVSPESESIGSDHVLHIVSQTVATIPETTYRCRVVAKNEDNEAGVKGKEGSFTTLEPFEILDPPWTSGIGTEAATLNASVNPLGTPAEGWFEYVDQQSYETEGGFASPNTELTEKFEFGSGESPALGSAAVTGLKPVTRYRYRLAVDNHLVPIRYGEERGFRTLSCEASGCEEAPDERRYEMVSPAQKNNAEIAAPTNAGAGASIQAASPDGEAVTFASFTAFADPPSAPAASQYLARRGGAGWSTQNINLFGRRAFTGASYLGFTPDLRFAGASTLEPPLTEDCPVGFANLYWRDNESGEPHCVTNETPGMAAGLTLCALYAGASADGSQVFFAANGSYAGAPKGKGFSLYQWSEEGGISLISKLPNGTAAVPQLQTGFGPGLGLTDECNLLGNLADAVSADGKRVFWTFVSLSGSRQLLARIDGAKTVQLDAVKGGAGPAGGGRFWAASEDGSAVFFTATNRLTPGANSSGADLYRYDFDAPTGQELDDLTDAAPASVLGVLGASDDGAWVYFAANGALSGEEENPNGEKAQAGQPNLYLWHEGEGIRFIATLSSKDGSAWSPTPTNHSARVTPDGRHLALTSRASLSGYDNTVEGAAGCDVSEGELSGTEPRCAEVYLYAAEDDALSCASCHPTGQRPSGPSGLPGWRNRFEGPRYLSEDGQRLFFTTYDGLLTEDKNGLQDVYEFERPGTGTCATEINAFVEDAQGCLFQISGGKSEDHSYLIDASADGRDVFFSTRSQLLGTDQDERYDLYDYRVNGFPPPPPPPPICEGEGCKPSPPGVPEASGSPATNSFVGPGNPAPETGPRRCPRGKRLTRRNGKARCVKRQKPSGHKRNQQKRPGRAGK